MENKRLYFATRVFHGPESRVGLFLHFSPQFPESRRRLWQPGSAAAWELGAETSHVLTNLRHHITWSLQTLQCDVTAGGSVFIQKPNMAHKCWGKSVSVWSRKLNQIKWFIFVELTEHLKVLRHPSNRNTILVFSIPCQLKLKLNFACWELITHFLDFSCINTNHKTCHLRHFYSAALAVSIISRLQHLVEGIMQY